MEPCVREEFIAHNDMTYRAHLTSIVNPILKMKNLALLPLRLLLGRSNK
jgi:hypothetical protein